MKKVLKWVGIVLGGLIVLLLLAVGAVYLISNSRLNKSYNIEPETVAVPTGDEAVQYGRHVAVIRGCADCHGNNLAGDPLIEDPALAYLYASNLTAGKGGIGGEYTNVDFVRAIRHGVDPDGKPLWFMPAQEFYYLNDHDLGALIAYIKSLPPVDHVMPENSGGLLGRILFVTGQLPLIPAELIDHTAARPPVVEAGVTAAYGEYLAVGCKGCHRANYAGGPIPGAPPDALPAANLTPAGELSEWTEEDFINTMRFGITPEGDQLDPEWMPWPAIGQMTDEELQAVWLYLQSLPPVADGG